MAGKLRTAGKVAAQIDGLVLQLKDYRPDSGRDRRAYAQRPLSVKRVLAAGVTVISRLRWRCRLWVMPMLVVDPGPKRSSAGRRNTANNGSTWPNGRQGPAAGRPGCSPSTADCVVKKYKTFLASYKPVGGVIRAALAREVESWWRTFTDPDLSVASILEAVADRSALEQVFHDVTEVQRSGSATIALHVWANVGAWNLIGWWAHVASQGLGPAVGSPVNGATRRGTRRSVVPRTPIAARSYAARRCRPNIRRSCWQKGLRSKSAGSFAASGLCSP